MTSGGPAAQGRGKGQLSGRHWHRPLGVLPVRRVGHLGGPRGKVSG
jgi:hypothetical protein